ncbi:Serine/threonine phosphatase stp [Rosistilla oblonga]|uniref:PP2C family protein-serine/threonine phosphatase n=1 Tax=Rosistilla oblonga TaxID=2527990 RepID=UPI00118D015A|nr:protein phosphatase 2C domain-containing protein [Rosistilla oblonga]QDV12324.1 Serine/threonine phosphatase stp [Rosistilla oblonga]
MELNSGNPGPAVIYCNRRMTASVAHAIGGGESAVFSSRSPCKETPNEDVAAIVPCDENSCVLIVADGMGGHSAGEVASLTAVREMIRAVNEALQQKQMLRIGIINGFERANDAVQAMGTGSGTTLAVVEISQNEVRPYHAGDSVVLVVGSRGKIKLETTSHSPVGFGLAAGLLDSSEAMDHAERHVILNAVGSPSMRIEIGSAIRLAARDTVMLASDGLTDNVTTQEAIRRIRKGKICDCANELTELATQRMWNPGEGRPSKPDDLTVLLFRRQSG